MPLMFEPYAADLATRVAAMEPADVLEVACGTGVVTRAMSDRLPSVCCLEATDLSAEMVAHAERVGTARPVRWGKADVMDLPHAESSFDVVVCQFGAMFFPDRVAAYREILRVLRPGGHFLFNLWEGLDRNEFAAVISEAVAALHPNDPPSFLATVPYSKGDPMGAASELISAGFEACRSDRRVERSPASDARQAAVAFCHGTPLRGEILERDAGGLESATAAATGALEGRFGRGPIDGLLSAIVVCAQKPILR